jgi:hypothetical protein
MMLLPWLRRYFSALTYNCGNREANRVRRFVKKERFDGGDVASEKTKAKAEFR